MKKSIILMTVTMLVFLPVAVSFGCQPQAPPAPAPTPTPTPAQTPTPPPTPPPAPPPVPEFRVSSLAIAPKETVAGESVTVTASVENIGKAKGTYRAALTVNGEVVESMDIPLNAGAKEDVSFKITKEMPGIYTIKLDDLTDTLKVLKPAKFTVTSLDISPSPVNVGDNVTVTMNLRNVGEAKGTHSLSLVVEGEAIETKDITLDGGVMEQVQFTVSLDVPGTHSIEVDGLKGVVNVADIVRLETGTYIVGREYIGPRDEVFSYVQLENKLDLDTVVVVTRMEKPDVPVKAVYIQSNSIYRMNLDLSGKGYLYYTCGNNWDNHSKKFTTNTVFIQLTEPIDFRLYWLKLPVQTDADRYQGIEYCSKDEFPKLR